MPRQIRWRTLWPGLALAAALVFAVAWVLVYARVGAVHGDTYRIFAVTNEARGVLKGTEVWLAGQKVGAVSAIAFRPVTTDTLRRLLLELEVLEQHRELIRHDSYTQIRPGGTLIGQPVVFIGTGTMEAPPLEPGDTLVARPQGDAESLASEMARVGRVFPEVVRNVKAIHSQLMVVSGVARTDDEAEAIELDVLRSRARRLSQAARGDGTVGLLLRGGRDGTGSLNGRVASVSARVDTLVALLTSDRTALGRFRRDSSLERQISELRDEVATLRTLASTPVGTIGRVRLDDAVELELAALKRQLDMLLEDVKRRPHRYIHF